MAGDKAKGGPSPRSKSAKEVPKSTDEKRDVPFSTAHVDRLRYARDISIAERSREARILRTRGMRQTLLGPDFRREPRGRHTELPHLMRGSLSRWHDYNCRVCQPSSLSHAPDCRRCQPLAAYAVGAHKLHPPSMNYLPVTMQYLNDAYMDSTYAHHVPDEDFADSWRRMKIARQQRAAVQRERTLHW